MELLWNPVPPAFSPPLSSADPWPTRSEPSLFPGLSWSGCQAFLFPTLPGAPPLEVKSFVVKAPNPSLIPRVCGALRTQQDQPKAGPGSKDPVPLRQAQNLRAAPTVLHVCCQDPRPTRSLLEMQMVNLCPDFGDQRVWGCPAICFNKLSSWPLCSAPLQSRTLRWRLRGALAQRGGHEGGLARAQARVQPRPGGSSWLWPGTWHNLGVGALP